jgi:hypothetical protein
MSSIDFAGLRAVCLPRCKRQNKIFITDGIFRRNVTPGGRILPPESWKGFKP